MIVSFRDAETEKVFRGAFSRKLPQDIQQRARRRLMQIHNASSINDLRVPPSNRLESLVGDRSAYWSIRINRQWRVVFGWKDGNASEVLIEDYH
ncbi:MAG: type II toxin-antitoxin system RelE/ParE family toxin [Verrucomicrobiota bacterium]